MKALFSKKTLVLSELQQKDARVLWPCVHDILTLQQKDARVRLALGCIFNACASGEQTEGGAGVVVEKRGDHLCSWVATASARYNSFEPETVEAKEVAR